MFNESLVTTYHGVNSGSLGTWCGLQSMTRSAGSGGENSPQVPRAPEFSFGALQPGVSVQYVLGKGRSIRDNRPWPPECSCGALLLPLAWGGRS